MSREQFLNAWNQMSFEERSAFVRLVIEEDCIDRQVPIPRIEVLPDAMSVTSHGGDEFPLGRTFVEDKLIQIYAGTPLEVGGSHFDNPWEAIATAFHESSHWFRANDGSSQALWENEQLAESYAQVRVQDWQRALEDYDGPPDPNVWHSHFYSE